MHQLDFSKTDILEDGNRNDIEKSKLVTIETTQIVNPEYIKKQFWCGIFILVFTLLMIFYNSWNLIRIITYIPQKNETSSKMKELSENFNFKSIGYIEIFLGLVLCVFISIESYSYIKSKDIKIYNFLTIFMVKFVFFIIFWIISIFGVILFDFEICIININIAFSCIYTITCGYSTYLIKDYFTCCEKNDDINEKNIIEQNYHIFKKEKEKINDESSNITNLSSTQEDSEKESMDDYIKENKPLQNPFIITQQNEKTQNSFTKISIKDL